jgi:predicted permease
MNSWRQIRSRVFALGHKQALDSEMDEEMRSHLEMLTAQKVDAGMSAEEARRAALQQFGWLNSIQEDCRETRAFAWLDHLLQDVRFALRMLRKNLGFTALAGLTLALGIGANTALFSVIDGVLLKPLPFPEHERLVTLWESNPGQGIEQQQVSPPTFEDWQRQSKAFEQMAFWTGPADLNLLTGDGSEKIRASYPSANLFQLLRMVPQLGRAFLPEEDRPRGPQSAIISHRLWRERFGGDPQVLGQPLTIDTYGRRTYTVVGVMPPAFQFPEDTELWLAAGWNGLPRDRRLGHWLNVLARLKPGITPAQAQAEMNTIQSRIALEEPNARVSPRVCIVPLARQLVGRNTRTALLVLWVVVAGVLLIACANVANLMLARAAARQKEIAVRLALGAGRLRIVRQLLTESVLLALLGGVLGLLFGYWGLKLFVAASPANIPRLAEVSIDGTVLCFTLAAAVFTGVVFGLAPAWQFSRPDLNQTLKENPGSISGGVSAGKIRAALVILEVASATVLLVGAGLMLQTLARLLTTNRGFRAEHVISADLDFSVSGFTTWVRPTDTRPQVRLNELLDEIRRLPGVQSAGAAYSFLRKDNRPPVNWPFTIFGRPPLPEGSRPTAEHDAVSPGYFSALGVPILRGRDLLESDGLNGPGVAVVNESFVRRFFPNEEPLGQHVSGVSSPAALEARDQYGVAVWCEIVGVVGDMKSLSPQPEPAPEVYHSYWQWPMQSPKLFVRATGDMSAVAAEIRRETKRIIPSLPAPKIRLLTEYVQESVSQPRFEANLLAIFGGLALLLAGCGIYGVLAFGVTQRQREIGVRMALGAQRGDVLSLVIRQGLKPVVVGTVIGIVAAFILTRVIRNLLYGVTPTDPLTFTAVTGALLFVALLACWLPARRAARIDPMVALRYE